jgi:AcrR family transcriptional regulator
MASEPRPLRADAERNRRRILDAARAVFAEHGVGAGIDCIARRARVGVGTIYRRFPTKELLLQAVVDDRIAELRASCAELGRIDDPWAALVGAAEMIASNVARDHGFYQALQEAGETAPVRTCIRQEAVEAIAPLVDRAQAAGVVRADVSPVDVVLICSLAGKLPRWRLEREPELWRRFLAIVLDGLRPEGAHPLPHPPPAADPRPGRRDDGRAAATAG